MLTGVYFKSEELFDDMVKPIVVVVCGGNMASLDLFETWKNSLKAWWFSYPLIDFQFGSWKLKKRIKLDIHHNYFLHTKMEQPRTCQTPAGNPLQTSCISSPNFRAGNTTDLVFFAEKLAKICHSSGFPAGLSRTTQYLFNKFQII